MNGQTKNQIIREMLDDLEAERGGPLQTDKRDEIADGLWVYLEAMERYFIKKVRQL